MEVVPNMSLAPPPEPEPSTDSDTVSVMLFLALSGAQGVAMSVLWHKFVRSSLSEHTSSDRRSPKHYLFRLRKRTQGMLLTRCIITGLIQARPDGGLWSPRGQASGDARLPRGPEIAARRPQPDLASSAAQSQPRHWPRGPGLLPHLRPLPTQPTRLSAGR